MRVRTRAIAGAALGFIGLFSAGFLFVSQARSRQAGKKEAPTVPVAVAARDIAIGDVVTDQDVRIARFPVDLAPSNRASSVAEVAGRAALAPIQKDEPLLSHRLSGTGTGAGLPILIAAGMRGLSVRVEDVIGIAGFVQPGSRVDVLVTSRSNQEPHSGVLIQDVKVLATGHQLNATADSGAQNSAVITVEVTPSQAELLTLASSEGRIQLAIRNPVDNANAITNGVRMAELIPGYRPSQARSDFDFQPPAKMRASAGPRVPISSSVEVFSGGTRAVTTIRDSVR